MDVRYVRGILEVARTRNMAAAAANLNLSQPALSRQVQAVERELGMALFDRTGRGMRLSDAGRALLDGCAELSRAEDRLRDSAEQVRSGRLGTLSIGATPQMIERLVAPFLQRFSRRHPDVRFNIVEGGGVQVLEMVENGLLRIGVAVGRPSDRVGQRPLAEMRVLGIRPRSGRTGVRGAPSMSLSQACAYPILALNDSFGSRRLFDSACRLEDLEPHHAFETSAPDAALAMAAAGHGLAVLPSSVDLRGTGLAAVPLVTAGGGLLRIPLVAAYDQTLGDTGVVGQAIDELALMARRVPF